MKALLAVLSFFIPITLFAQIETKHIEEYKELTFNLQGEYTNSIGTAFIVGKNEYYYFLATAKHVLNGSQDAVLTSLDGTQYRATLVAEHDVHDLALLQTTLFPLPIDVVPIVTDIAMNDEVGFISLKDKGKVLPSKETGIVRDVTGESLSVIMKEVELGHSGSPLFSKDGIAGIITKNGRFIECLNIMLVQEIVEEWGKGLFEGLFVEREIQRPSFIQPSTILDKSDQVVMIKEIRSEERCYAGIAKLVDRDVNTGWSCTGTSGISSMVWLELRSLASVSKIKVYISNQSITGIPYGDIHIFHLDNKQVEVKFNSVVEFKEREGNGFWYTYILKKPVLATGIAFEFRYIGSEVTTINFNEIQIHGIPI